MPKTRPLTQTQRQEERDAAKRRMIGDGLTIFKARNKLTNRQLAAEFGVGHEMVAKILDGEEVKLSMSNFWRLLDIAGLELTRRTSP